MPNSYGWFRLLPIAYFLSQIFRFGFQLPQQDFVALGSGGFHALLQPLPEGLAMSFGGCGEDFVTLSVHGGH